MDTRELLQETKERMEQVVTALHAELAKLRTGRAHPALLEHISVESYGSVLRLKEVASITLDSGQTLLISPWDTQQVPAIEKAISESDLGLSPVSHGDKIRVTLPALTQERRQELMKVVGNAAEKSRVAVRGIRRDVLQRLKESVKDKHLSEDEERSIQGDVQKLTDHAIASVDELKSHKDTELQTV